MVYWPVAWRHWREDSSQENHEIWETDNLNDHEVVYRPTAWPRQRGGSSSVDSPSTTSPVPYHSKNPKKLENPTNPKKLENPKNPKKLENPKYPKKLENPKNPKKIENRKPKNIGTVGVEDCDHHLNMGNLRR